MYFWFQQGNPSETDLDLKIVDHLTQSTFPEQLLILQNDFDFSYAVLPHKLGMVDCLL